MDLNKHIVTDKNNSTLHSSGLARISSGDRLGSTSQVTFTQRQQVDSNRQLIKSYNRSKLGSSYSVLQSKRLNTGQTLPQQRSSQIPNIRRAFVEPKSRNYSPFS